MSDLISRQDAIDMFQNLAYDDWNQGVSTTWANAFAKSADMIKDLPFTEPERKRGRWILTEDENYEYCTCSECGYQNGENWMNGSDIPFCANCGADMRGE